MATKYTFNFTDTNKPSFDLQSYTVNGLAKPSEAALMANASSANTTLKLYGKGLPEYGEGVLQDIIYMLENFANADRPHLAIEGQMWYENVGGELFIRNATGDGSNLTADWDAVILATGTSAMTGHLSLIAADPTDALHAVSLGYLTTGHFADDTIHITADQNTFLDALTLPTLTGTEVNQLIGISTGSTVQAQLDGKLNLSGGTMVSGVNINFGGGGEVLGLPVLPSATAATSKEYVDNRFAAGDGGDGVLTSTQWLLGGGGSPADITQTTLELTVTLPGGGSSLFEIYNIARVGHTHDATDVTFDNTFNPAYPTTTQAAIEYTDSIKVSALNPVFPSNITVSGNIIGNTATFGSTVSASEPTSGIHLATKSYVDSLVGTTTPEAGATAQRLFNILTADLISPATYTVQRHLASDDTISITINGVKQYLSTRAEVDIQYAIDFTGASATGLDQSLNYEFDITVDGGSPPTTITITAGTDTTVHGFLATAINQQLGGSPPLVDAQFTIEDVLTERFTTTSHGSTSSIVIADPGGANTYLFTEDLSPATIVDATFFSDPPIENAGSPPAVGTPFGSPLAARPDTIEIFGDVRVNYPVGQPFAIRGSDDAIYGSYDGVYSVHVHGATYDLTNTIIPIAIVDDETLNIPLLPTYTPQAGGSPFGSPVTPIPAPSPFGSTYISPLVGFDSVATPVAGLEGDYIETDASGNASIRNTLTSEVVFNYDILNGSKIETLRFT